MTQQACETPETRTDRWRAEARHQYLKLNREQSERLHAGERIFIRQEQLADGLPSTRLYLLYCEVIEDGKPHGADLTTPQGYDDDLPCMRCFFNSRRSRAA